jgi:nitrate reductase gamma subunit
MGVWFSISSLILIVILIIVATEVLGLYFIFTVFIPYIGFFLFLLGFIYRVLKWAASPVPFHIPTISGQQKSLPWIKPDNIDSPFTTGGIIKKLALDILFFRTLLRNEKIELEASYKLLFKPSVLLWLGAMAFHWSFFYILIRHLRFFLEPVPSLIVFLQRLDSILQGLFPIIYISDIFILLSLVYLFIRRILYPQVKYISLFSDYFILLVIFGIACSGVLMRLIFKVDLIQVKQWFMSTIALKPALPKGVNIIFYIHLFFVSLLMAYFPFSKLMHMPGIFLSPTKNLKNTSRSKRHINPWNYPVKIHSYEEYEEEFRDSMKEVGLPLEKE